MNPNSGESQANFEIPKQAPEGEAVSNDSLEKSIVGSPENRPQQSVQAQSQAASAIALPAQSVNVGLADDAAVMPPTTVVAQPATDTDRIEKEWVDKAKSVISKTREDPYEQKIEMSRVKADYIKKRFNKTIKTDDTVTT